MDYSQRIDVIRVDENGYMIDIMSVFPNDVLERNIIKESWSQRIFVPKWDFENNKWIEGLSPEEVAIREQEINEQSNLITDDEMNAMAILELSNIILGDRSE